MKHNWELMDLSSIGTVVTGCTPSTTVHEYYDQQDYMFIKPGDIGDSGITYLKSCDTYISKFAFDNASRKLPKNSVLVTCIGTIGKVGILHEEATCNQQINAIIPFDSVNYKYLGYAIFSIKDILTSKKNGPVVPIINKSQFSKFKVPVPPMEVQERIVAELDKINEVIEDCRSLQRNLDALAQSLFYDYFGDPITNPKGWEMKKLSDECLDIVDGDHSAPPKSDKGIPFITISNIDKSKHKIDFTNSFFVPQNYYDGLKENRKARKGDVLYTVTGSYGVTVLITDESKFCFQRHIGLIRPKTSLNSVYMAYWGRSSAIKSIADTAATGIAQKTISIKALRNFPLILPPIELQDKFAERIEQIDAQKKTVEKTIERMQTLLASRMDYWFND